MYKCKECGAEYENKPDYCDCGNDEFETVKTIETPVERLSNEVPKENISHYINENQNQDFSKIKSESVYNNKQDIKETYSQIKRYTPAIEPISLIIFILCLILSLYIIFFAWNPNETDTNIPSEPQNTNTSKTIPNINKIWNNTPPKNSVVNAGGNLNKVPVNSEIQEVKPIQQIPQEKKNAQVNKPKQTSVPLQKITTKSQTKSVKNTTNTQKQTVQKNNAQSDAAKKQAEEAARKQALADQERKKAEELQIKKLQEEQAKKAKEAKEKQEAADKQEFKSYKNNLRNTIARKIDFTKVIGDGSCTVSFKIDSTGKLINRSFTKQSSNNTLNDAVYEAVMSTPTFMSPPSAYKNEFLNLNIKFSNGNFEIFMN